MATKVKQHPLEAFHGLAACGRKATADLSPGEVPRGNLWRGWIKEAQLSRLPAHGGAVLGPPAACPWAVPPGGGGWRAPRLCTDVKRYFTIGLGTCFVPKMLFLGEALFQGKNTSLKGGGENMCRRVWSIRGASLGARRAVR